MASVYGGRHQGPPRPCLGPQPDDVSSKYSALADDTTQAAGSREAAMLMVSAEGRLHQHGDTEGALQAAVQALEAFRAAGDLTAEADAVRMVVLAHRLQADNALYDGGSGAEGKATFFFDEAERKAREQLQRFKDAGNKRGQGAMLLSLAEIADDRHARHEPDELREVLELAKEAASALREAGDRKLEGIALLLQSIIYYRRFEKDEALAATEAALEGFRAARDRRHEGKAIHLLAYSHVLRNDLEEGIKRAQEALALFREEDAKYLEAFECFVMADYYLFFKKGRDALILAEDAQQLYKELAVCRGWEAHATEFVVQALILRGEERKALLTAKDAAEAFQEQKDRRQQAVALHAVAEAYMAIGDFDEALRAVEDEQGVIQDLGDARWEAAALLDLATVHLSRSAFAQAADAANEAIELYQNLKDRVGEALAMEKLKEVQLAKGDEPAAQQTAVEQRAIYQELGDKARAAGAQLTIASIAHAEGRRDEAVSLVEEAMEWFIEAKDKEGEARCLGFLASFHLDNAEYEQARDKAQEMRECLKQVGDKTLEAGPCRILHEIYTRWGKATEAARAARDGLDFVRKAMDKRQIVDFNLLIAQATTTVIQEEAKAGAGKGIEKALRPAKEALTVAKSLTKGKNGLMAQALYQISTVQMLNVRVNEAMAAAREAVEIFRALGDKAGEAGATVQIAEIHYTTGMQDKALDAAKEGQALAQEIGETQVEKRARDLLEKIQGRPRLTFEAAGALPALGAGVAAAAPGEAAAPGAAASVAVKPKGLNPEDVLLTVQEMAKQAIGLDDELFLDSALMDSGMDSLTAVSFRNGLQQVLGVKLPSSLMFDYPTMKEVSNRIVELSLEDE